MTRTTSFLATTLLLAVSGVSIAQSVEEIVDNCNVCHGYNGVS